MSKSSKSPSHSKSNMSGVEQEVALEQSLSGRIWEMDEEVEEAEDEVEKSDSFTGMSPAAQKKHQVEYLRLRKEIECQNKIVDQLKDQLVQNCQSPCMTKCEIREISKLRGCMEAENLKLQCMVQTAIKMQNELPSKCWAEIPIVTTIEDDVFPIMGNSDALASLGLMPRETTNGVRKKDECDCVKSSSKKKPCVTESDTCKLFEEISKKDRLIECLNEQMNRLQDKLEGRPSQKRPPQPPPSGVELRLEDMQYSVDVLNKDLKKLLKQKQACDLQQYQKKEEHSGKKSNELKILKEDYAQLLCCLSKKEAQLQEMAKRVKGYCGGGNGIGGGGADNEEMQLLREKVNDLRDEQDEYTCIIKEQSEQIDDYRKKYMDAQQRVEEQKCILEKIEMNNKRIEGQIEAEVKTIKAKFKEQLSELSQYPKLLENEQLKLATASKDREELENKLRLVCKELKAAKEVKTSKAECPETCQKLAQYESEMVLLETKLEDLEKEKDIVVEELVKAKQDLDTIRAESAKIITSTKERFQSTKTEMSARIDMLEKELAQCRANASLSITDRENVIKEMQSQLSTLSYSFDSAQKQIKTLKNHISFLSNDQCIPVQC